jgi:aspartate kinase
MKILKFGGTSLASAQRIKNAAHLIDGDSNNLVVLSAMSGITNTLSDIYFDLLNGKSEKALDQISKINLHFNETAYQLFEKNDYLQIALEEINSSFIEIKAFNETTRIKELLSYGEIITTRLFSIYLNSIGRSNTLIEALDFMILNEDGEPDMKAISQKIKKHIDPTQKNHLYITQGFICRDKNGNISNLKRGGSDYTATIIGAAIHAENITIWTDIDGLHNNDPRYVNDTKAITDLNFDEAAELAYFGAKILHPSSIRPARDKNIPVLLKNTLDPEALGTLISENKDIKGIKAIAAKDGIQIIRIQSGRMLMAHGFLKRVFGVFDRFKVPVDVITTSEVSVSITIENNSMINAIIFELQKLGEVELIENCSIISAVGSNISINPKVLAPLFSCLSLIQPRMISLGGSRNNITIVLDSDKKIMALNLLNESIFKNNFYEELAS